MKKRPSRKSSTTETTILALRHEEALQRLRDANARLARQLAESKHRGDELVSAVYRAVADATSGLKLKPIARPTLKRVAGTDETAIALLSDWQLGKRTPTYNTETCERRVEEFGKRVVGLTEVQRTAHPVSELHVFLLGDMLEGELIFAGQAHRIDASLYRQLVVDGPRILCNFLRTMLAHFKTVRVFGVIGNHGAIAGLSRKEMHPESNADMMLYTLSRQLLADEPRLHWTLPFTQGERSWYTVDRIGDHQFFLFHGDQMRGGSFGGLPFYGFARAINNWAAGVIPEGFDYAACGHWHQAASIPIGSRLLWVNGSTESSNTWLQEELKTQCPPSQWVLFAHPKRGVTSEYRVWLT